MVWQAVRTYMKNFDLKELYRNKICEVAEKLLKLLHAVTLAAKKCEREVAAEVSINSLFIVDEVVRSSINKELLTNELLHSLIEEANLFHENTKRVMMLLDAWKTVSFSLPVHQNDSISSPIPSNSLTVPAELVPAGCIADFFRDGRMKQMEPYTPLNASHLEFFVQSRRTIDRSATLEKTYMEFLANENSS
jgi:hypothetical protein